MAIIQQPARNPTVSLPVLVAGDSTARVLNQSPTTGGRYLIDYMTTEFTRSLGKLMIPTDSGAVPVTVHAPFGYKVVTFEKVREESAPVYPLSVTVDANAILLHEYLQTYSPGIMNNGETRIFAVRGRYIYGLLTPIAAGTELPVGLRSTEVVPTFIPLSDAALPLRRNAIPAAAARRLF